MPMFAGPDDLREAGRTERAYEKAIHPIVYRELAWREPIPSTRCDDRVVASRWTSPPRDDLHAITPGDSHVVAIFLRATRGTIRVDGQSLSDGVIPAGSVVVTAPGQAIHATFG